MKNRLCRFNASKGSKNIDISLTPSYLCSISLCRDSSIFLTWTFSRSLSVGEAMGKILVALQRHQIQYTWTAAIHVCIVLTEYHWISHWAHKSFFFVWGGKSGVEASSFNFFNWWILGGNRCGRSWRSSRSINLNLMQLRFLTGSVVWELSDRKVVWFALATPYRYSDL